MKEPFQEKATERGGVNSRLHYPAPGQQYPRQVKHHSNLATLGAYPARHTAPLPPTQRQVTYEGKKKLMTTGGVLQKQGDESKITDSDLMHSVTNSPNQEADGQIPHTLSPPGFDLNQDSRSKEEKQLAVDLAQGEVEQLITQVEDTATLQAYFPMLAEKYGLKRIFFENLGQPDARVVMEVNPKAAATATGLTVSASKEYELNGRNESGTKLDQDVKFYTKKSKGGYEWGVKMVANPVGPEHPKGFGPQGMAKQMAPLPTNRKKHKGDKKHFIKGHLLNDNLGGPGKETNMFPITEAANKNHSHDVEETVKEWVNVDGYYAYYSVEIKNIKEVIDYSLFDDAKNYVNAEMHIHAYTLDASGNRSNSAKEIKTIIKSEYDDNSDLKHTDIVDLPPKGISAPVKRAKMHEFDVELSTTKDKGGRQYDKIENWLTSIINDIFTLSKDLGFRVDTIIQDLKNALDKPLPRNRKEGLNYIVKVASGEYELDDLLDYNVDKRNAWNGALADLESNKDDVVEAAEAYRKAFYLIESMSDEDRLSFLEDENLARSYQKPGEVNLFLHDDIDERLYNFYYPIGLEKAREGKKLGKTNYKQRRLQPGYRDAVKEYFQIEVYMRGGIDASALTTEAHEQGKDDYNEGLTGIRERGEFDLSPNEPWLKRMAVRHFWRGVDLLDSLGLKDQSHAGKKAIEDYMTGIEQVSTGDNVSDKLAFRKAKQRYMSTLQLISAGQEIGKSPAAETASADYTGALEAIKLGEELNEDYPAHNTAKEDYEYAINELLLGNTPEDSEALTYANNDYGIVIGLLRTQAAVNRATLCKQLLLDDYEQGIEDAATEDDVPTTAAARLAYDDYNFVLSELVAERDVDFVSQAHTESFENYMSGCTLVRPENMMSNKAARTGFNHFSAGYMDGAANLDKANDRLGYLVGYNQAKRKAIVIVKDKDDSGTIPPSKRYRYDPHALDI